MELELIELSCGKFRKLSNNVRKKAANGKNKYHLFLFSFLLQYSALGADIPDYPSGGEQPVPAGVHQQQQPGHQGQAGRGHGARPAPVQVSAG